ncbi:MAG: LysR family transcriptional regulator [Sporomusaceae bacterium]|nr:LysR family transcriptional regulator [Sporomusaceae bacterium]
MTERELLYVKTVADEKSLSKAAKKLFLTQPSLSVCMQKIETNLGIKLFKRTSKGLLLTFAGERYYQMATDILKIYNDFEIEVSDINNLKKGRMTIGITVYLATYMLPLVLPAFKQKCPNIEIFIIEKNSTELDKALASGEIDFAIMHTFPFNEHANNINTKIHPLFKDPLVLVTKPNHPLRQYAIPKNDLEFPQIDLTLFAQEPFIMLHQEQKIRQVTDLILQKAAITPTIALTTKSYETARRLACEGLGITLVPRQYLDIFPSTFHPDYYHIEEKYSPYWTMCVAVQKDAYISRAARLFISMITEQFHFTPVNLNHSFE